MGSFLRQQLAVKPNHPSSPLFLYVMSRVRGQRYMSPFTYCSGPGRQHTEAPLAAAIGPFLSPLNPSQPMMSDDVNDEDRPQHRELRPLLLSATMLNAHEQFRLVKEGSPRGPFSCTIFSEKYSFRLVLPCVDHCME